MITEIVWQYKALKDKKYHDVSRTNGVWSNSTILRLLADERYIGTYVIGKKAVTEIGGNRMRTKDEEERYFADSANMLCTVPTRPFTDADFSIWILHSPAMV